MRLALNVLACLLTAGCAHDRNSHADPDFTFTRLADQNRDGHVTREEAEVDPKLVAAFDRYDLDKNDKLDRGEFARLEDGVGQADPPASPVKDDAVSVRPAAPYKD